GGLHGVGVSVTNALSKRLVVTVWRDGKEQQLMFVDGNLVQPLTETDTVGRRKSGTRVRVWPDPKYFDSATIPAAELVHSLRSKAVLLGGIKVVLVTEKTGDTQQWQYEDGLKGYLNEALADAEKIVPLFEGRQYAAADDESF